ncbi:MAG TPA: ATP-binding protein [Stellaceae bacterium]|nr:ATP-binding protein [Stellaceae bacterium]
MAGHQFSLDADPRAIPRFLDWVAEACAAEGLPAGPVFKMTLALEEAVTNAINYAFTGTPPPHRLIVRLAAEPARLVAEVIDNGAPFDPLGQAPPDLARPLAERAPGGLGIHLIRGVMDRVEYRREDGLNRLLLEKRLEPAQGR